MVWDPDDGPAGRLYHEAGGVAPWMLALFERLQPKKTYIATYELLAEVCAYTSFPDVLRGRIIYHFVDNTAALAGSIKAFSSRPDCARTIDALISRILNPSTCRIRIADDGRYLARRDPTAARDRRHEQNQAHRVVSTT